MPEEEDLFLDAVGSGGKLDQQIWPITRESGKAAVDETICAPCG
jgi:hypothetical protein